MASLGLLSIAPGAADAAPTTNGVLRASWTATAGLNSDEESGKMVRFDPSAYAAMRDDATRTPKFERAVKDRIRALRAANAAAGTPDAKITVLDLGTGPFALFAIVAAQAGADRVYALEADRGAAASAREAIAAAGLDARSVTVVEGLSTDFSFPNNGDKADFLVAEVVGSIASEEGAYATVVDAGRRLLKRPESAASYVPRRIQTYAAPASYTLHTLFAPPAFDWNKMQGEPVRFNCRDQGLQLLSDGQLLEDVDFVEEVRKVRTSLTTVSNSRMSRQMTFTVDPARVKNNQATFYTELVANGIPKSESETLCVQCAHSVSGIALWPRIILGDGPDDVIDSRGYLTGAHQKSHWQTVLPIMAERPVGPIDGGETIQLTVNVDLPLQFEAATRYAMEGSVVFNADNNSNNNADGTA